MLIFVLKNTIVHLNKELSAHEQIENNSIIYYDQANEILVPPSLVIPCQLSNAGMSIFPVVFMFSWYYDDDNDDDDDIIFVSENLAPPTQTM